MAISYLTPEFEVLRDPTRCIACRVCERQCANGVHFFDDATEKKSMAGDLQISDVHRITGTSKDGKDTLFTLKEGANTTSSKRLFTLMTGMQIHTTPDLFLIKERKV